MEGVASVKGSGSSLHRNESDWENFYNTEVKKLQKKTIKQLAQVLAAQCSTIYSNSTGLPQNFPVEVIACCKAGEGEGEVASSESAEADLVKLKKDTLVSALSLLEMEDAKKRETADCETWSEQIKNIIQTCSAADGCDGELLDALGLEFGGQSRQEVQSLPELQGAHVQWQAQRFAAFATCLSEQSYHILSYPILSTDNSATVEKYIPYSINTSTPIPVCQMSTVRIRKNKIERKGKGNEDIAFTSNHEKQTSHRRFT